MVLGGLIVDQRGGEYYSYGVCIPGEEKLVLYTNKGRRACLLLERKACV